MNIKRQEHYGERVWVNADLENLRRKECLCLHCDNLSHCSAAKIMKSICVENNLAFAMTRCKDFS
jgi:hypothetical protein